MNQISFYRHGRRQSSKKPPLLLICCLLFLLSVAGHRPPPATATGGEHTTYLPVISSVNPYVRGTNLLNNASFEGGWYHPNNIPELQIPNDWQFSWLTGPTGHGNEPWDVWVRPEVRVLPSEQLPPPEHPLFIYDGNQTVKIFKGFGAISFTLTQDVWLEPGTYHFELSVFPDLVVGYDDDGNKIYAPDPLSGEVKLLAGNQDTGWLLPTFGQKNTYYFTFTVDQAQSMTIGASMQGRYAIQNNGWFMDDWWLWDAEETLATQVVNGRGRPPAFSDAYTPPQTPYPFPEGHTDETNRYTP